MSVYLSPCTVWSFNSTHRDARMRLRVYVCASFHHPSSILAQFGLPTEATLLPICACGCMSVLLFTIQPLSLHSLVYQLKQPWCHMRACVHVCTYFHHPISILAQFGLPTQATPSTKKRRKWTILKTRFSMPPPPQAQVGACIPFQ